MFKNYLILKKFISCLLILVFASTHSFSSTLSRNSLKYNLQSKNCLSPKSSLEAIETMQEPSEIMSQASKLSPLINSVTDFTKRKTLLKNKKSGYKITRRYRLAEFVTAMKDLQGKEEKDSKYYEEVDMVELIANNSGNLDDEKRIITYIKSQAIYLKKAMLEIIDNGQDALRKRFNLGKKRTAGRFGVGAYQVLNELENSDDLVILETSKDGNTGLRVIFWQEKEEIYFDYQVVKDSSISRGTKTIVRKKLLQEDIKDRKEYLERKLRANKSTVIKWQDSGKRLNLPEKYYLLNNVKQESAPTEKEVPAVILDINEEGYFIADQGVGMDLKDVFERYLVPKESDNKVAGDYNDAHLIFKNEKSSENSDISLWVTDVERDVILVRDRLNLCPEICLKLPDSTDLTEDKDGVSLVSADQKVNAAIGGIKIIIDQLTDKNGENFKEKFAIINSLALMIKTKQPKNEKGVTKGDLESCTDLLYYLKAKLNVSGGLIEKSKNQMDYIFLPNELKWKPFKNSENIIFLDEDLFEFNLNSISNKSLGLKEVKNFLDYPEIYLSNQMDENESPVICARSAKNNFLIINNSVFRKSEKNPEILLELVLKALKEENIQAILSNKGQEEKKIVPKRKTIRLGLFKVAFFVVFIFGILLFNSSNLSLVFDSYKEAQASSSTSVSIYQKEKFKSGNSLSEPLDLSLSKQEHLKKEEVQRVEVGRIIGKIVEPALVEGYYFLDEDGFWVKHNIIDKLDYSYKSIAANKINVKRRVISSNSSKQVWQPVVTSANSIVIEMNLRSTNETQQLFMIPNMQLVKVDCLDYNHIPYTDSEKQSVFINNLGDDVKVQLTYVKEDSQYDYQHKKLPKNEINDLPKEWKDLLDPLIKNNAPDKVYKEMVDLLMSQFVELDFPRCLDFQYNGKSWGSTIQKYLDKGEKIPTSCNTSSLIYYLLMSYGEREVLYANVKSNKMNKLYSNLIDHALIVTNLDLKSDDGNGPKEWQSIDPTIIIPVKNEIPDWITPKEAEARTKSTINQIIVLGALTIISFIYTVFRLMGGSLKSKASSIFSGAKKNKSDFNHNEIYDLAGPELLWENKFTKTELEEKLGGEVKKKWSDVKANYYLIETKDEFKVYREEGEDLLNVTAKYNIRADGEVYKKVREIIGSSSKINIIGSKEISGKSLFTFECNASKKENKITKSHLWNSILDEFPVILEEDRVFTLGYRKKNNELELVLNHTFYDENGVLQKEEHKIFLVNSEGKSIDQVCAEKTGVDLSIFKPFDEYVRKTKGFNYTSREFYSAVSYYKSMFIENSSLSFFFFYDNQKIFCLSDGGKTGTASHILTVLDINTLESKFYTLEDKDDKRVIPNSEKCAEFTGLSKKKFEHFDRIPEETREADIHIVQIIRPHLYSLRKCAIPKPFERFLREGVYINMQRINDRYIEMDDAEKTRMESDKDLALLDELALKQFKIRNKEFKYWNIAYPFMSKWVDYFPDKLSFETRARLDNWVREQLSIYGSQQDILRERLEAIDHLIMLGIDDEITNQMVDFYLKILDSEKDYEQNYIERFFIKQLFTLRKMPGFPDPLIPIYFLRDDISKRENLPESLVFLLSLFENGLEDMLKQGTDTKLLESKLKEEFVFNENWTITNMLSLLQNIDNNVIKSRGIEVLKELYNKYKPEINNKSKRDETGAINAQEKEQPIWIRELIQNAIDAIRVESRIDNSLNKEINIRSFIEGNRWKVVVKDHGGMDLDVFLKKLLNPDATTKTLLDEIKNILESELDEESMLESFVNNMFAKDYFKNISKKEVKENIRLIISSDNDITTQAEKIIENYQDALVGVSSGFFGQGFFTIFGSADEVLLRSGRNGKVREFLLMPRKDANSREIIGVQPVWIKEYDDEQGEFKGTEIVRSKFLNENDPGDLFKKNMENIYLKYQTYKYVGMISKEKNEILWDDELINEDYSLRSIINNVEMRIANGGFKRVGVNELFIEDLDYHSPLFKLVPNEARDILFAKGININLPQGTPIVRTRKHIQNPDQYAETVLNLSMNTIFKLYKTGEIELPGIKRYEHYLKECPMDMLNPKNNLLIDIAMKIKAGSLELEDLANYNRLLEGDINNFYKLLLIVADDTFLKYQEALSPVLSEIKNIFEKGKYLNILNLDSFPDQPEFKSELLFAFVNSYFELFFNGGIDINGYSFEDLLREDKDSIYDKIPNIYIQHKFINGKKLQTLLAELKNSENSHEKIFKDYGIIHFNQERIALKTLYAVIYGLISIDKSFLSSLNNIELSKELMDKLKQFIEENKVVPIIEHLASLGNSNDKELIKFYSEFLKKTSSIIQFKELVFFNLPSKTSIEDILQNIEESISEINQLNSKFLIGIYRERIMLNDMLALYFKKITDILNETFIDYQKLSIAVNDLDSFLKDSVVSKGIDSSIVLNRLASIFFNKGLVDTHLFSNFQEILSKAA